MPRAATQTRKPKAEDRPARRRMRGFEAAALLVAADIRRGAESRGFAVARLLTHWPEIVGADTAARTRPVKVSHGKGFGATLTLLTAGAHAPLVQMDLPRIRARVNACYGFNAVARIVLTQTAAHGFAEGQASFAHASAHAPGRRPAAPPGPERLAQAEALAAQFSDPALAGAMRQLALNTLSRRDANDRKAKT